MDNSGRQGKVAKPTTPPPAPAPVRVPVLDYNGIAVQRLRLDFGRDQVIFTPEGNRQERVVDIWADQGKASLVRPRAFAGNGGSAPDVSLKGDCLILTWAAYDQQAATTSVTHFPQGTAVAFIP